MKASGRLLLAVVILLAVASSIVAFAYLSGAPPNGGGQNVRNFTIMASITGFNDSADHGVPANPWPVIQVSKGTLVNITVYNQDRQSHSFQVAHYFDSSIQTIAPGQKLNVSFVANETGTFSIKCVIPCSIHWAMQSGELIVS